MRMRRKTNIQKQRLMLSDSLLARFVLALSILALASAHRHSGRFTTAAAIFGIGGKNDEKIQTVPKPPLLPPPPPRSYSSQQHQQQQLQRNLQPPPPPHLTTSQNNGNVSQNAQLPPRPPFPPFADDNQNLHQIQKLPPPPPGWGQHLPPPPPMWDYTPASPFPTEALIHDLDQALLREAGLAQQVHNMSTTLSELKHREERHLRQIDVLTERIMEEQAGSARKETALLEVQANCTALHQEMAILKGEVAEYEERCAEFAKRQETLELERKDLHRQLKLSQREAENLATLIERHRLQEEQERKKSTKKKSRGFFAWLFGIRPDDEEDWDELKETARSTLLQALQNERNSVEELENVVASLQANNSAIADQVESRDAIIDELNSRIAVFEEDKVVLKAALRQLQKEIKEEAPKTARLQAELKAAQDEIVKARKNIEMLRQTHINETSRLNHIIARKESHLNETKANLTMIGTYVDKLEERLADFAVARRDIQVRSKKLDSMETQVEALEAEKDILQDKIASYEKEHSQLKKLMEEMAAERSSLMRLNLQRGVEQNTTQAQLQELYSSYRAIESELHGARNATAYWEQAAHDLEYRLQNQIQEYEHMRQQRLSLDSTSEEMRERLEQFEQQQIELQNKVRQAEAARNDLMQKLETAVRAQIMAEEKVMLLQKNLTVIEQQSQDDATKLAEAMAFRQKMQDSLLQSHTREAAIRQEAKAKEESLLRKIQEQEEAFLRREQQSAAVGNAGRDIQPAVDSASSQNGASSIEDIDKTNESDIDGREEEETEEEPHDPIKNTHYFSEPNDGRAQSENSTSLPEVVSNFTNVRNGLTNKTQRAPPPRFNPPPKSKESVVRSARKLFARATGIHGFFSGKKRVQNRQPPSKRVRSVTRNPNATNFNGTMAQKLGDNNPAPRQLPPFQQGRQLQRRDSDATLAPSGMQQQYPQLRPGDVSARYRESPTSGSFPLQPRQRLIPDGPSVPIEQQHRPNNNAPQDQRRGSFRPPDHSRPRQGESPRWSSGGSPQSRQIDPHDSQRGRKQGHDPVSETKRRFGETVSPPSSNK